MTTCGIQQTTIFMGVMSWALVLCIPGVAVGRSQEKKMPARAPLVTFRPLSEIEADVRPPDAELPPDRAIRLFNRAEEDPNPRSGWYSREFHWEAPEYWHQPLYFDDVPLEHYGQSCRPLIQTVKSGAHFFGTLPMLPYKMGVDRPYDKIPTLGYYRVGSCAPSVRQRMPLEGDAALFEASVWIALIFLLP
ncbi:MAG: hypothetical protein ACC628_05275 [Pirellulaceae bacterium]